MLLEFTIENFRSYREAMTFSLIASSSGVLEDNTIVAKGLEWRVLRAAAIFGANASGKSNLLVAMDALSSLLESPLSRQRATSQQSVVAFALDPSYRTLPTKFQVRFVLDGCLYDYELHYLSSVVSFERLCAFPNGKRQEWFVRDGDSIETNRTHLRGQKAKLISLTGQDTPFLAVASAFSHEQLEPVNIWLTNNLGNGVDSFYFRQNFAFNTAYLPFETASRCYREPLFRQWASSFLQFADLGIQAIDIEVQEREMLGAASGRYVDHIPYFTHVGEGGYSTKFKLDQESHGTRKLFAILNPLYVGLLEGKLVAIDEFGEGMHPLLVQAIVRVFNDPNSNPHGAQLVFTTHDTTLLKQQLLRRDQVWLAQKTPVGSTTLRSLHDYDGVREDEAFDRGYLRGRYDAIPVFAPFPSPFLPELKQTAPKSAAKKDVVDSN